jgi:indole-3-glycerol phosphate synthase
MAAASHARVTDLRARESFLRLRARAQQTLVPPPLRPCARFELIAEYKRQSPAVGSFRRADPAAQVTAYGRAGAAAVSVLTEPAQFGGDLAHLKTAAEALTPLGVPVMRKDFLVDPYQVVETRAAGGGGVLLILRMLSPAQLVELLDCAREMSLFVLLEAFDEEDLERAESAFSHAPSAKDRLSVLLGVNCRDLRTLAVRPGRFLELASRLPPGIPRVAESGIETAHDCAHVARAGFEFALVGSALMKSPDPAQLVAGMLAAGRSA